MSLSKQQLESRLQQDESCYEVIGLPSLSNVYSSNNLTFDAVFLGVCEEYAVNLGRCPSTFIANLTSDDRRVKSTTPKSRKDILAKSQLKRCLTKRANRRLLLKKIALLSRYLLPAIFGKSEVNIDLPERDSTCVVETSPLVEIPQDFLELLYSSEPPLQ